jgi:hypothetical protein
VAEEEHKKDPVIPRRVGGAFGLSNDQIAEALKMHSEYHASQIVDEVAAEYEIKELIGEEFRSILVHMVNRGMTVGMSLTADPRSLADWYMKQKALSGADLATQYEFEEGMGVSGVLLPNGVFLKCASTEHALVLRDYTFEEQFTFIYFSGVRRYRGEADPNEDGDGIITTSPKLGGLNLEFSGATVAQLKWITANFKYFDRGQKRTAWVMWDIGEDDDL